MSSPTIGTPASSKLLRPFGVGRKEHGNAIDHADAGFQASLSVVLDCLLRADRQVAHAAFRRPTCAKPAAISVGSRSAERKATSSGYSAMCGATPSSTGPAWTTTFDTGSELWKTRVLFGLAKIASSSGRPTLRLSMSKAATNSTSLHAVAADGLAHHAVERCVAAVAVIFHALHQCAGAIADTGDGDLDVLWHAVKFPHDVQIADRASRSSPVIHRRDADLKHILPHCDSKAAAFHGDATLELGPILPGGRPGATPHMPNIAARLLPRLRLR